MPICFILRFCVSLSLALCIHTNVAAFEPDATNVGVKLVSLHIFGNNPKYNKKTFEYTTTGNAAAIIDRQDAKIKADVIRYNASNLILGARGNVQFKRNSMLSKGDAYKFSGCSEQYLFTEKGANVVSQPLLAAGKITWVSSIHDYAKSVAPDDGFKLFQSFYLAKRKSIYEPTYSLDFSNTNVLRENSRKFLNGQIDSFVGLQTEANF